jgi:hypothetical protein
MRVKEHRDEAATLELLEEFQSGYPIARLRELLSGDSECGLRAGIWIASELGHRIRPVLDQVAPLLKHPLRVVRFFALDCVLTAAGKGDGPILGAAARLLLDEDSAVRWKAMSFLTAASEDQITEAAAHAGNSRLEELLFWLKRSRLHGASAVSRKLSGSDPLEQRIASVAAARLAETDSSVLEIAARSVNFEVRDFAVERLDWLGKRPSGA